MAQRIPPHTTTRTHADAHPPRYRHIAPSQNDTLPCCRVMSDTHIVVNVQVISILSAFHLRYSHPGTGSTGSPHAHGYKLKLTSSLVDPPSSSPLHAPAPATAAPPSADMVKPRNSDSEFIKGGAPLKKTIGTTETTLPTLQREHIWTGKQPTNH
jgi:hypothetical protein